MAVPPAVPEAAARDWKVLRPRCSGWCCVAGGRGAPQAACQPVGNKACVFFLARLSDLDFLCSQNGDYVGLSHRFDVAKVGQSRSDVLRKNFHFDVSSRKGSLATEMTFSWESKCAIEASTIMPLISDRCYRQVSLRVRGHSGPVAKQLQDKAT